MKRKTYLVQFGEGMIAGLRVGNFYSIGKCFMIYRGNREFSGSWYDLDKTLFGTTLVKRVEHVLRHYLVYTNMCFKCRIFQSYISQVHANPTTPSIR